MGSIISTYVSNIVSCLVCVVLLCGGLYTFYHGVWTAITGFAGTVLSLSVTRGAGSIPSTCPTGQENSAGLCYSSCKDGYSGALTMCVPSCPSDFRDDGLYCYKPDSYGRGSGYAWAFGDGFNTDGALARCNADNPSVGCEINGALAYPKCKAGYHNVGCCVCSPDCPSNTVDIGVSCQKSTYDRGVSTGLPGCAGGQELNAGLCYNPCPKGYPVGAGPVCWK